MLSIVQLPVLNDNYIYLLHEPETGVTAVVDPAVAQPVLDALAQRGWRLTHILNTHHHHDHVGANLYLQALTGCQIIGAAVDRARIPGLSHAVNDQDRFGLGQASVQVIATHGHTSGHISYYIAEAEALFCGDTLFVMGCGRLFDGTIGQLWHSLQVLKTLPASTRVYCAHEYTEANGRFALSVEPGNQTLQDKMVRVRQLRAVGQPTVPSTLAEELATNPFLRTDNAALQQAAGLPGGDSLAVFSRLRAMKDTF